MGAEMRLLRFTKLLLVALLLVAVIQATNAEDRNIDTDGIRASRIERDLDGVTTVLLVPARPGKSAPPLGLLTKTARTFVQDGASTEYATQVLGTTLDNGRLYARILSTSSRVFYDREPSPDPTSAFLVFPSRDPQEDLQLKMALENAPISVIERFESSASESSDTEVKSDEKNGLSENDVYENHYLNSDTQRFKPAKVRPAEDLPTYTVKQEYVSRLAFDSAEEEEPKNFRSRAPKIFKTPPKVATKKPDLKFLATVTYHGFADFTTTVGETVIVFSPSTSPAPIGRPATSIKGDATLRPDDGIAVLKIRPTNVVVGQKKTDLPSMRNRPQGERYPPRNLGAKNNDDDVLNLQPSVVSDLEAGSTVESTAPLPLDVQTDSVQPTGLLKVIDSTTSLDGTTTHYKSLIYGTYVGTNYAQVIHTSSNVYYFPDESSATLEDSSPREYPTTEAETEEYVSTTEDGLTTLFQEVTENTPTTPRFRLRGSAKLRPKLRPNVSVTPNTSNATDDEISNAIVPLDPQGRSIKGGAQRNQLGSVKNPSSRPPNDEVSLSTRLLPSTIFKTFTYFTTFFIPGKNDQTTTSVKTREAVSSEVTYLTELILPTATQIGSSASATLITPQIKKKPLPTSMLESSSVSKNEDQEIELIFKTLYTTYTYLTTFFQENTSSVSSREVVETNVITQTLGPNGASVDISGLFDESESILIAPTRVAPGILSTKLEKDEKITTENLTSPIFIDTTEDTLTTLMDEPTTEGIDEELTQLEPSESSAASTMAYEEVEKTYFTTYTYFTTIFVEDETEIETRTEVFSNVVTEKIQPTSVKAAPASSKAVELPKQSPPPEILAYLEALKRQKSQEEALKLAKKVQEEAAETTEENEYYMTTEGVTDLDTDLPTTFEGRTTTEKMNVRPNARIDGEVLGSMITDVISSSSSGGGTVLDVADKKNIVPEDQEISESNHHDVEPVPTHLLQTSYTTFTYFTTMYKGDASNVISRLETVTNVVTETIQPSVVLPAESSTLPVTYFTTFTYWTTFYKGGDTITTSREETVSNVVEPGIEPTPTLEFGSVMTYRPDAVAMPVNEESEKENELKITADNEVASFKPASYEKPVTKEVKNTWNGIETVNASPVEPLASTAPPDPTTFYTTYTYFTTSYAGNSTILNSRLETVTSVYNPEESGNKATGRAIGGALPTVQILGTNEKSLSEISPSKVSEVAKTGLISTLRSSQVGDGTTTHYMTDVYGTYIDGLYAQVVQSSTKLETPILPTSASATPSLSTGVLSVNKGSIVDADKISTVYFTTKQIGTLIDGLYAKVIESTSSTKIDEAKLATHSPVHGHRTGLVRLIQGNIVANDTSIFYESKVIGTSIDGRYAQIIESTSSYLTNPSTVNKLAPTATLKPNQATGIPDISPSPAVIESSLSEDPTSNNADESEDDEEEGEEEEEDEDGQKNTKKSRLTFSSRKRTFTPVIRPFASRNRPTFAPKRKNAQGATTITRTDVTPTVTATLAGKGNRYASSRGRVTSPIGPYSSTLSPTSSRRFAGRRVSATASSAFTSGAPAGSTRGRAQVRITPSSAFSGSRRGPSSIRGSSARPASRIASSSIYPGASSRYRPGIRPSSTLAKVSSTLRQDDQEDNANEFTATTIVTEETPYTVTDEDATVTPTLQTTTESPRRSTNPLLRFRNRPPLGSAPSKANVTPRTTTPTPRRANNLTRQNGVVSRTRLNLRQTSPLPPTRPRQTQTGLFPRRGLFGKTPEPDGVTESVNQDFEDDNLEDDPVEEISDNDYEGSENKETSPARNTSRTAKSFKRPVQIRPFNGYGRTRRTRRQASQLRSYSNRFRRPGSQSPAKLEERSDTDVASSDEDVSKTTSKYSKYGTRGRSLSSPRPSLNANKPITSAEKNSAESSESSNLRKRPKPSSNRSPSPRVKPSPVSGSSRQFTLREKDTSSRPSYKRPSTSLTRRTDTRPRTNSWLKSGSSRDSTRRVSNSRSSSRSGSSRNSNKRLPSRSRGGSHEDFREAGFVYPDTDGTITVTHYVPAEVTVPFVNNGVTEKRNIITAQPSTQVLAPELYSTVLGGDGNPLVVIASQMTSTNLQGQVEVTRFLLHEKPTSRVSYTLTTLGGRRASQSVIIPSTIYSVENIVSTIQPSLPGANSPLANILLSQLLLGQLGQQNPLLGGMPSQATPTTRFDTRTTSYVTTITNLQSTIIPLTFRGKEILTTIVDSSTNVVTATEYITDTVVVTPTAAIPVANLNSLLYLLQQPSSQQQQNALLDPLFAAAPLASQSNTLPGEVERRNQPVDFDYKPDNYDDSVEEETESPSRSRVRNKVASKGAGKKETAAPAAPQSSVVTLYVSGRTPGEFSTVLTTVKIGQESSAPRRRRDVDVQATASLHSSLPFGSESEGYSLSGSEEPADHSPTQSLESVVDEYEDSQDEGNRQKKFDYREQNKFLPVKYTDDSTDSFVGRVQNYDYDTTEEKQPKRVRVLVPVERNRNGRQHARTVVRRRPLVPYSKSLAPLEASEVNAHSPRRIVVTRVRTLGSLQSSVNVNELPNVDFQSSELGKHKVTITRRRKIRPSTSSSFYRERVTRKKLVSVRPIPQPSPTLAIITTGFFTAPSDDDEDEEYPENEEISNVDDANVYTPKLQESPNTIENKPSDASDNLDIEDKMKEDTKTSDVGSPVIITDNFFFPAAQDDGDDDDNDDNDNDDDEDDDEDEEEFRKIETPFSQNDETLTTEKEAVSATEKPEDSESVPKVIKPVTTEELPKITTETIPENLLPVDVLATTESSYNDYNTSESDSATYDDLTTTFSPLEINDTVQIEKTNVTSIVFTEKTDESVSDLQLPKSTSTEHPEPVNTSPEVDTKTIPSTTEESTTPFDPTTTDSSLEDSGESLTVKPLETHPEIVSSDEVKKLPDLQPSTISDSDYFTNFDDFDIPSVIPLDTESSYILESNKDKTLLEMSSLDASSPVPQFTTTFTSPTPEDIEAGLADDLYLSLSRPDFPPILPSKPLFDSVLPSSPISGPVVSTPELKTSVYYTETIVTSTRQRTYTYVVTKLNGLKTEVTSSTTIRPRVTTLTLTVPITVTVTPSAELTSSLATSDTNPELVTEFTGKEDEDEGEGEGRKFNLATRKMSNGVEVIVAGPTPALRWENSNPQPTLTLSDTVVMLLPQETPNEFVTKTCTTTFTYLNTFTKDGITIVSTDQQVIANTATEERHRKPASEAAAYTLEASPTLQTEVFKTTYTYLTLNTDHPNERNALESSSRVIANTITAPQYYLDMILEPSEAPRPETNTYLSTRLLEKTIKEDGRTRIETMSETVTQLIITESAPPPRPISVETTLTALDENENPTPDITKTYYITYTYFNTFLEKDSTVIKTNVATSTDYVLEKAPKITSIKSVSVNQTPDPIQIYATKTYLTTFTYFTTLLQAGLDGKTATTISSRSHIVENVVTESIEPSLLEAGYMNSLLTTSQHSDTVNNVVTGSTIIFFDDEEEIDPTSSSSLHDMFATASHDNIVKAPENTPVSSSNLSNSESDDSTLSPEEQESSIQEESVPPETEEVQNKRPAQNSDLQVSNLLSLGSLGINSLSALGPVITAMAGLLQGKTANRRNDTASALVVPPAPTSETSETTTSRSPIYIPVAEFADGDIETAESQNIAYLVNANHNHIPETRHKVTASLADGIPISPGEVITANSDVIIGKPGKLGPRPPQTFVKEDKNIGMKPPPVSIPNIPVHPVLEIVGDNRDDSRHRDISQFSTDQLEIIPAHQIYEQHINDPSRHSLNSSKRPQGHPLQPPPPPKRISSKHDILENDPLLRPPNRSGTEPHQHPHQHQHQYPHQHPHQHRESQADKSKLPWSLKDPLTPPLPTNEMQTESLQNNHWSEDQNIQNWSQNKQSNLGASEFAHASESRPTLTEPIVHQVPHVIDRGTGQPLLVNIQPSQIANVVIPQGGTQALIFGDTNEPHISGQYFDDPSPYPETEGGPGFSISKGENINQYQSENDPADYMMPPSPPKNYKPVSQKPTNSKRPHVIPLSQVQVHHDFIKPHSTLILRPVESYPVRRPEAPGILSDQGHVHTEILVHHKPETVNLRPQSVSHRPHPFPAQHFPPRRDFQIKKPTETTPPRRTEISTEKPHHEYVASGNLDTGNEVSIGSKWKLDQKPQRTSLTRRPRPTFRPRYPTRGTINLNNRPTHVERPIIRQPLFPTNQRLPKPQSEINFTNRFTNNKQNGSTEKPKSDFPYEIVSNLQQPSNMDNPNNVDHQDSISNFYQGTHNVEKVHPANTQTERTDEHIPTGAVEYKNPSSEPQMNNANQQYSQSDKSTNQEEKPVLDSETSASNHVKFSTAYEDHDNVDDNVPSETQTEHFNLHIENSTTDDRNAYKKPGNDIKKPEVSFQYNKKDGERLEQNVHDHYGVRPYETPIIQGKPFGVWKDHENGSPVYGVVQGTPYSYHGVNSFTKLSGRDDTIDLKPPAIIPQFELNGHSRPFTGPEIQPGNYQQPEIITKSPPKFSMRPQQSAKPDQSEFVLFGEGHIQPGPGQVISVNSEPDWSLNHNRPKNQTLGQSSRRPTFQHQTGISKPTATHVGISRPEQGSGVPVHPEYPHIITKPKPRVPAPITVSSGSSKQTELHKRPNVQFSLPIEAIGDEEDSKTQTERPPSLLVKKPRPNKQPHDETLETAYQTNFASNDSKEKAKQNTPSDASQRKSVSTTPKPKVPSQNMMPPPRVSTSKPMEQEKKGEQEEGLKPPPPPTDVVGLSPPPVYMTTKHPADSGIITPDEFGLRPPALYIPLKESGNGPGIPPPPSVNMVPPSPRPTHIRPFLADILSEDMVPPPPVVKTSRPLEIATVRPAVAVSGSIQIAAAVATSHIPVMQDVESKIPIVHGTVDLPVVVDVPEILRPVETRKSEHVSIYTARPFETKPVSKVSIQPSAILTTNLVMSTITKPSQIHYIESSRTPTMETPTTLTSAQPTRKTTKRPEHPVFLESSMENIVPSTRVESTETLTYTQYSEQKERRPTSTLRDSFTKVRKPSRIQPTRYNMRNNTDNVVYSVVTEVESSVTQSTPSTHKPKEVSVIPKEENIEVVKEIIETVVHEVVQNGSTTIGMKPKEFTRFKTLTITRTQTSVLGSPPTTRTLLLTHTLTSTSVETITETLVHPTSVISTITSTILQSIPTTYENDDNDDSLDSIFVVMSDQKPPEPGAEEVEAEYGDEVSRDEQDPAGNEIHRVLAGGILGAPVIPLHPVFNQCVPECKASKAEMCSEFNGEMRCVCRPGFARMFPDRPCKPTYTYTLRVGLDRIGHDSVVYVDSMNDTSSSEYRQLAPPVKEALDRTLMQSDLRDLYQGVKIAGFAPDPVQVKFHVYLFDNANETRLKEVIRKYLVRSNYSLGGTEVYASKNLSLVHATDFDECAVQEDGWSHHDCSMNAVCFNLPGSYQCSCKEGWADLSENSAYPGRFCSQAPLGCAACNNKGHCVINSQGHNTCECFPWHSGQKCQVNLKVLLIALVTTGAILLGLLGVCIGLACFRHPGRRRYSGDRRAMIPGTGAGGDTSSEGSITELEIPHHVPHVLPPPPQMIAPAPPAKRPIRKPSNKLRHQPRKVVPVVAPVANNNTEQRDRSLTVMIPRAKYRSAPQSSQPNYKPTIKSTFSVEEHKLIDYLEGGVHPGIRKPSVVNNNDCKEAEVRVKKNPISPGGALVSAGFQVSATVTRTVDAESTLARSCGETTVEPSTKVLRTSDFQGDLESSLARSCTETTIQTSANQLLRLDLAEAGSTLARSCGETTIQPPTKLANSDRKDNRDARDSQSDGHTMAERDLGSTLRLPAQHAPLYNPDRANSDRESNFDSL